MSTATEQTELEVVPDEYELLARMVRLRGARVLDLGCGAAQMSRRVAGRAEPASVVAVESDEAQLALNLASAFSPPLHFDRGVAEALPYANAAFDVVMMLKSLHHVPAEHMDRAFREVHRVLAPDGRLYLSEPVFAGELNEVMRLFHDEEQVRAEAIAAIRRAIADGLFVELEEKYFTAPVAFRDFADFEARMMNLTHTALDISPALREQVRAAFLRHCTPSGVRFLRPMRVNLLAKAGEGPR